MDVNSAKQLLKEKNITKPVEDTKSVDYWKNKLNSNKHNQVQPPSLEREVSVETATTPLSAFTEVEEDFTETSTPLPTFTEVEEKQEEIEEPKVSIRGSIIDKFLSGISDESKNTETLAITHEEESKEELQQEEVKEVKEMSGENNINIEEKEISVLKGNINYKLALVPDTVFDILNGVVPVTVESVMKVKGDTYALVDISMIQDKENIDEE